MDDLISRQAAIKLAIDLDYESRGILKESRCREIESRYNMIPPAQTEKCEDCGNFNKARSLIPQPERKRGKWEVHNILDYAQRPTGRKILRCPFCRYLTDEFRTRMEYYHILTHFCANCGAEMEGSDGFDPGRL